MPANDQGSSVEGLKETILRHWGFPSFRPLQEPAMKAVAGPADRRAQIAP
jgi:hypothetical protein